MKQITINVSDDMEEDIESYTQIKERLEHMGSMDLADWETARSLTVDIVGCLLRNNPKVWTYKDRMRKISDKRKER